jgi:hypothetical protein
MIIYELLYNCYGRKSEKVLHVIYMHKRNMFTYVVVIILIIKCKIWHLTYLNV